MRIHGIGLWFAVLLAASSATGGQDERLTREQMQGIFGAMSLLLPMSLEEDGFEDPAQREEIRAALRTLSGSSQRLAEHGSKRDVSFAVLSRSLARDARDIEGRFEVGEVQATRFLVQQMVSTCIDCHSRLPAVGDASLSARFAATRPVQDLPLAERAKLEYAIRQFDDALESYERLLEGTEISADALDLTGYLDDYLDLSIRVRGDVKRPHETLTRFARRKDLSPVLRGYVDAWLGSLAELAVRTPNPEPLVDARALLEIARDVDRFPNARSGLVYYIEASSVLHRFIASRPSSDRERAEALYQLGGIESRVGSFWNAQAEAFLETAIRIDPDGPFALDSYAMLEEFLVLGFTGSAGTSMPEDVVLKLQELETLVQDSQSEQAGRP